MSPVVDLALPPAEDWQAQARAARISTADLLAHVGLKAADFAVGVIAQPDFPLSVLPHYLSLIRRGDPADPLLLQVLARAEEALPQPGRLTDPLEEADLSRRARRLAQISQPGAADRVRCLRNPLPLLFSSTHGLWQRHAHPFG